MKKEYYFLIIVFLMAFFYALFLIHGLPFYSAGSDDFYWMDTYSEISLFSIGRIILFTPNSITNVLGVGDLRNIRPVQVLITQIIYRGFGLNAEVFYFYKVLNFTFLILVFFIFMNKILKQPVFSFLSTIFFMTLPNLIENLMFISDVELLSQLFIIITFLIFLKLYESNNLVFKYKFLNWLFLFFFAILSIKTKETGRIVFLVPLTFLLISRKKIKRFVLFLLILLVYLIPFSLTKVGTSPFLNCWNLKNLFSILFKNPFSGYHLEKSVVLFDPLQQFQIIPGSLLSLFGFFLGWILIFGIIYLYIRWNNIKFDTQFNKKRFLFVIIWFVLTLIMFLFYSTALRFLLGPSIALTLWSFSLFYILWNHFSKSKFRAIFLAIFLICLFLTIGVNFYHSVQVRGGLSDYWTSLRDAQQTIFKEEYNLTEIDTSLFFDLVRDNFPPQARQNKKYPDKNLTQRIFTDRTFAYLPNINLSQIKKRLTEHSSVYAITFRQNFGLEGLNYSLITEIKSCYAGFYCWIKNKVTKKEQPILFVYKIASDGFSNDLNNIKQQINISKII